MIKQIETNKAPKAVGPYSQAILVDNLLYVSGQLGMDYVTGNLSGDVINQAKQALDNLEAILNAGHSDKHNVIKCTIYLKDMNDFAVINKIYEDFFGHHKPARATIEVARLPKDGLIEIDAIALVDKNK